MPDFPHMHNRFPNVDTVNVNQWENDFDYSRYDYTQMQIMICAVPWDMGEAHIGNRTISGIGNVVYFGSKKARDAWFDSIPDSECFRFESKYKALHRDLYIDVPIPFDIASKYNYMTVKYALFANDDSPVMYEGEDGHREWFWFIREVEYLAPNTTRLHILDDAFQTWIYDIDVSGMVLERGHAPMYAIDVDEYLADPIDNARMLLCEDVDFGRDYIARSSNELILNAKNMYALIVTGADISANWGTKSDDNWTCPGKENYQLQGLPSYYAFAVRASDLSTFLANCASTYPQFIQTIKAVAFVSSDLVTLSNTPITFASTNCYPVTANYKQNDLIKINRESFGFDKRYADIAKLYTYPYSYILVTDEQGRQTEIHIENTNGRIRLESTVSLVFPWLTINGHLSGIGKTPAKSISFANVDKRTMPLQGNWYDYLMSWNIPTFGIIQDAGNNNDYGTYFDRKQQKTAADNEYTSRIADADTLLSNASAQQAANTANASISATATTDHASATTTYNSSSAFAANYVTSGTANSQIAYDEEQGAIAAASGAASGIAGALGNLASGNIGGAIGTAIGAGVGVAGTMAQTAAAINLKNAEAQYAIYGTSQQHYASDAKTNADASVGITVANDSATVANTLTGTTAANSAGTAKANALRSKNTSYAAIDNQVAQADINSPIEFGAYQYGDLASSRPMGLFANVVTESDAAISKAGDEFLRYGYMYDQYWEFDGNWNVGKYYTYWKLKDFWVSNLNVPDMYMDKIRFFLFGGVTVWRKPEYIGHTSIYENI